MKITKFETFLANAGLRNYLFIRLSTDSGLSGVGEATLEWQEKTVETLAHEWVAWAGSGPRPVRHRGSGGGDDPRPVPGRSHGDDGHQRGRDRALGPGREGLQPARLPADRGTVSRSPARLRQRLVRRRANPGRVRRAGPRRRGPRLSGAQVRPVRQGLEGAVFRPERGSRRDRRGGSRGRGSAGRPA